MPRLAGGGHNNTLNMKQQLKISILLIVLGLAGFNWSAAQNIVPKNSIYLELVGNGALSSLNYERNLVEGSKIALLGRIGATGLPASVWNDGTTGGFIGIPIMANAIFFEGQHHLEIGAGPIASIGFGDYSTGIFALTGTVAYRLQKAGGFLFKVGFTPIYRIVEPTQTVPLFGLSFGYAF